MKISDITVKGYDQTSKLTVQQEEGLLSLRKSYLVGQGVRGEVRSYSEKLEETDVVELVFEDGTSWFSSAGNLEDIFPEAAAAPSRDGKTAYEIPSAITLDRSERGIVSKVLLKVINIFTKKAAEFSIAKLAGNLEDKQLEGKIGLFELTADFQLNDYRLVEAGKPSCLLIHGTASSIKGSFGEARDTQLMKFLRETYGNRILAYQHRTLTESPFKNVRDLMKSLPAGSELDIITTSRGGLVGEVLARFCNYETNVSGFNDTEISILKNNYSAEIFNTIDALIREITNLQKDKKIKVRKFIRIACPAGGTTLASDRMDNFFNLMLNLVGIGTGLAANPVYQAFKELIAAVIDCKDNVDVLPGLEAQNPDSPFIKALNSTIDIRSPFSTSVINNSLVVIAGNSRPEFKLSALLIIASKLFFMRKNDMVVDTASMSLGTRRTGKVQQFFCEEPGINHFRYFENKTTSNAILLALKSEWGQSLPGFTEEQLSIPLATERNALLKLDSGSLEPVPPNGNRPVILLLPGIMGSNLSSGDAKIWINYWKFITGGLTELKEDNILASSLVATSYRALADYFRNSYDVVVFPFDWRHTLEESAQKLNAKILELMELKQPIKIIGHSMGGVLVRDFMVLHRDTWQNLNKSAGFRLIFLGSPLQGSFRIPAVLFGMDGIIDKLSKIDLVHNKKELVALFTGFRGILNLLPFSEEENFDFAKQSTWEYMRRGIGDDQWPLPVKEDLNWFGQYRNKIKTGTREEDFQNAVYIAGKDKATPCSYRLDTRGGKDSLVFLSTAEGDQSVTWESGIPQKMIDNKTVYYVDVSHGALSNDPEMFTGIRELLASGSTSLFSKNRPVVRGEEKLFRSPVLRDFDLSQAGIENTLLGISPKPKKIVSDLPIRITISHGDLHYAKYPMIAGHFENDGILFAEKAINKYLNNALNRRHQIGSYPGIICSSELFLTDQPDFKGAIIVGLGKQEELTASELTRTVEQAVAKYLLHVSNNSKQGPGENAIKNLGISSLLIGSGYGGLPVENSVKAIIQGVQNANLKIRNLKLEGDPAIEHIEFVELYEDKAVNCLYSISRFEKEENKSFNILLEGNRFNTLLGAKKRIPMEKEEEWWNRITVRNEKNKYDEKVIKCLKFSTSTTGSQEKERELLSTPALIEEIIEGMSTDNQWTPERAKAIFELLIPNDFKEQLKRHGNINWILDHYTASYPWELLQDSTTETKPMCVAAGMIRQLNTRNDRLVVKSVSNENALIIADPQLRGFAPQLPGALREGQEVLEILNGQGFVTTPVLSADHTEIVEKLFCNDYKIIHLSGHGIFNEDVDKGSGMVIGNNIFLSTREISQMSTVPELVFVNCCHLGKSNGVSQELYQQRYKLAANIGTQLIENGVRCVIAAGWAVNDEAALEFARVFYKKMFDGYNFGDSVKEARNAIFEQFGHSNTWGAYQCYGDPFYKFRQRQNGQKTSEKTYLIAQEAEIDLINLLNDLEIGSWSSEEFLKSLNEISAAVDKVNIRNPFITEYEALIYLELREYDLACEKFGSLLKMEDASFSFSIVGKLYNARAKKIVHDADPKDDFKVRDAYLKELDQMIAHIECLKKISENLDLLNILASTYKRKAFLLRNEKSKENAFKKAAFYYQVASVKFDKWYSLTNWLILEGILVLSGLRKWDEVVEIDGETYRLPTLKAALDKLDLEKNTRAGEMESMNYWDMIATINIHLCKYVLNFSVSDTQNEVARILEELSALWKRAGSKGKRFAEIEHLEFIINALDVKKIDHTIALKKNIEKLKSDLENLIIN